MRLHKNVLGLSGGKDSSALAVFMREHYPELDIDYFFTDTGKELPETYEFLGKLEGFLGKPIERLNARRDFDFWLQEYKNFLPSPQVRWCTRQLKIKPFEDWILPHLLEGGTITSFVAIRADEADRNGYTPTNSDIQVKFPFQEHGIDKVGVIEILEKNGIGLPDYYRWRSRSGCFFCFYQQKIEWVRLKKEHPDKFEEAKRYEKEARDNHSPFTWAQNEWLTDLEKPQRIQQIEDEHARRLEANRRKVRGNPLLDGEDLETLDLDELYGEEQGRGACLMCHK
jgi:hypothetical protein